MANPKKAVKPVKGNKTAKLSMNEVEKIPVTVLTGFLGSGKTVIGLGVCMHIWDGCWLGSRQHHAHSAHQSLLVSPLNRLQTLLNHILTQQHGLRIAVIENEFGEV